MINFSSLQLFNFDRALASPEVPRPFELMLTSSAEKSIKGKVERHAARANYDIKSKLSGDLKKKARAMDVDELAESTYWKWNEDTGGYLLAERNQDPITERQVLEEHVLWAANKRFEISKFKFKFPRART